MKVFIDAGPILWLVEGDGPKAESVRNQLSLWLDRGVELGAATQTLAELLMHPKALGDATLQYRYRALFCEMLSGSLLVMDDEAAALAAQLVGEGGLDFMTASQLAVASTHGYDVFFTTQDIPAGLVDCTVVQCFGGDAAATALREAEMREEQVNF